MLLLDREGKRLLSGAAGRLPVAYFEQLRGIAIGASAGSCGTAAFTRQPVYTSDIASDPYWGEYGMLPLAHRLRAC